MLGGMCRQRRQQQRLPEDTGIARHRPSCQSVARREPVQRNDRDILQMPVQGRLQVDTPGVACVNMEQRPRSRWCARRRPVALVGHLRHDSAAIAVRSENLLCALQFLRPHNEVDVGDRPAAGLGKVCEGGVHALGDDCLDSFVGEQPRSSDGLLPQHLHPVAAMREMDREHGGNPRGCPQPAAFDEIAEQRPGSRGVCGQAQYAWVSVQQYVAGPVGEDVAQHAGDI